MQVAHTGVGKGFGEGVRGLAAERHGEIVQVHDPPCPPLEGGLPRHLPAVGAQRVPRRARLPLRKVRTRASSD